MMNNVNAIQPISQAAQDQLRIQLTELKFPINKMNEWTLIHEKLIIWSNNQKHYTLFALDGFVELFKFEYKENKIVIDAMAKNIKLISDFPQFANSSFPFIRVVDNRYISLDVESLMSILVASFNAEVATVDYLTVEEKETIQIFKCAISDFVSTDLDDFEEVKIMNMINPLQQTTERQHFFLVEKSLAEGLRGD